MLLLRVGARSVSLFCTITPKAQTPVLHRRTEEDLKKNWWSVGPFLQDKLIVPVFCSKTGKYLEQNVELDNKVFNVPIRRDLIYRLADWRMKLDTFSTKKALTKGDVSGSGKKPMAQKETGRARVGNKRAPGRKRGGKAHGPKPVVYSYILNSKIKLQALKSLLTCKLAEGRVRIVTNFTAQSYKSKDLLSNQVVRQSSQGMRLLVYCTEISNNLNLASRNIRNLAIKKTYDLDPIDLLKFDRIIMTKEAVVKITQDLNQTRRQLYWQRHQPRLDSKPEEQPNPFAEFNHINFKFIDEYKNKLEQAIVSHPQALAKQMQKTRRRKSN